MTDTGPGPVGTWTANDPGAVPNVAKVTHWLPTSPDLQHWEQEYQESLRRDLEHLDQQARRALGAWARQQLPPDE